MKKNKWVLLLIAFVAFLVLVYSQKLIFFLSKITCAFAMAIAVLSVNSTCCFTAYQPDVPESLDRN
ncbi:MAG: cyclic lactone autoinducer peptide [Faecalibacterium prausnitzii]